MSPIPHNWQVPEKFRDRMGNQAGHQRCMIEAGHLLVILHDIPDPETPDKREAKLFWRSPEGTWQSGSSGGPPGIGPLKDHVEAFVEAANRLEERGDHATTADDWFALIYASGPMVRSARNMHHALQEARETVKADRALIAVRDRAGDAQRAFELIHAHAQEGLRYTSAKRAEEQGQGAQHMLEAAHRLNMIAAVFLPVTAVATLLGMNLKHGLEDERFFLGGDGLSGFALDGREIIALRGYQNNSLTPIDAGTGRQVGGTIFDKYTLEMRYPLSLNPSATIFALAFAEGGNSWLRFREFNPFEARRSLGAGIRIFHAGLRPAWSRLGLRIRQTSGCS